MIFWEIMILLCEKRRKVGKVNHMNHAKSRQRINSSKMLPKQGVFCHVTLLPKDGNPNDDNH